MTETKNIIEESSHITSKLYIVNIVFILDLYLYYFGNSKFPKLTCIHFLIWYSPQNPYAR